MNIAIIVMMKDVANVAIIWHMNTCFDSSYSASLFLAKISSDSESLIKS